MSKNQLLKITLLPIYICLSFVLFDNVEKISGKEVEEKIEQVNPVDSLTEVREKIREQLIDETKSYILTNAENANVDEIAPRLVDQSLGNNIDLCFILAQCQIETVFGTKGMGRHQSKKSMFGIDKTYENYVDCIDHYITNLNKHYISENRGIEDLLKNYTTHKGYRYAEDLDYERKLNKQYNKIVTNTNINNLEHQYKEVNDEIFKLLYNQNVDYLI